jgi:hypothetical protein
MDPSRRRGVEPRDGKFDSSEDLQPVPIQEYPCVRIANVTVVELGISYVVRTCIRSFECLLSGSS